MMGFFDFFRREERQSAPYTDAIVAQIIRSANQVVTSPAATAAVEAAAGIVSRAFALASVRGADLPPEVLSFIAREMIVRGECVLLNEGGDLVPVSTYEVRGVMPSFDSWIYRIEVTSPGGNVMAVDPALRSRVFHARYSYDAARPWVGVGPLQRAVVTGELAPADRGEPSQRAQCQGWVPAFDAARSIPSLDDEAQGRSGSAGWADSNDPVAVDRLAERFTPTTWSAAGIRGSADWRRSSIRHGPAIQRHPDRRPCRVWRSRGASPSVPGGHRPA